MTQKPILQTFALSKHYKEFKALDSIDMTVYEGDIYGFVGENGSGKTTLIRLISGLIHPTSGEYALFGVSCKEREITTAKAKIAAIVESVAVNKGLTALDNLRLQCNVTGIKKTDEELNKLLSDVGLDLEAISNKKAGSFSLGMRQRLGLAITLISEPKLVMLDEPMNGLDPQGFVDIRETILKLNKKGVTFLISSHILSELDKVCTRVGFLSHGHLLQELSIDELHNKARRRVWIKSKNADEIAKKLLEGLKLKEIKVETNSLTIYDEIDINDVMAFLTSKKIKVEGISSLEETIEEYYSQIMNGGSK